MYLYTKQAANRLLVQTSWQARRDSNPQHAVLETAALPIGATGLYSCFLDYLSSFTMQGVMATPLAILLQLDAVRVVLLVLFGRVIAALALGACHSDQSTHEFSFYRYGLRL